MRCKPGQRCMVVSAHPATPDCNRLLIGRAIVKVTDWHSTFVGPAWSFEGPPVRCPRGACLVIAFLDCDLHPLPPEWDCIDIHDPVDIEIDIPDYADLHLEPTP